ncbi:3-hydroxyacyl-ACP dehydratase FabZ family protein [Pectinatus haikarae]|uniref:3-hydroxyacyl-[acyl-carrier-protein] dehydratase n=1 Tax=Pectinatus haikarae TaxID=349096 RepID=A0ABT9YAS6_9FIRM|nr:hypothetical protein [Pectinatus haikarae]MDQ0204951.1 3-hydroxyacyl-[acyl-carrier-protein] dehydratase [Pectinatus haikarae]
MKTIKDFLPQREPFLFVDEILSVDNGVIIGSKKYDNDIIFYQNFGGNLYVPSMILLESLMQCGGAGSRMIAPAESEIFVVTAVRKVKIKAPVCINDTIIMKIQTLRMRGRCFRQKGSAFLNGKFVLGASWQCMSIK